MNVYNDKKKYEKDWLKSDCEGNDSERSWMDTTKILPHRKKELA